MQSISFSFHTEEAHLYIYIEPSGSLEHNLTFFEVFMNQNMVAIAGLVELPCPSTSAGHFLCLSLCQCSGCETERETGYYCWEKPQQSTDNNCAKTPTQQQLLTYDGLCARAPLSRTGRSSGWIQVVLRSWVGRSSAAGRGPHAPGGQEPSGSLQNQSAAAQDFATLLSWDVPPLTTNFDSEESSSNLLLYIYIFF